MANTHSQGLERRLPDLSTGDYIKGRGPEDLTMNDHGSMLSMCIMQQLFTSDALIAPTEQSDVISPMELYDYGLYDASSNGWVFWDPEFSNDLENNCHNSYGCIPLTGKRKHQNWGVSTNNPTGFALVGTRGPVNGVEDPFAGSNMLHGIDRSWKGPVFYGDGHGENLETFHPIAATYINDGGEAISDNIFYEETDQATDIDYGNEQGQGADSILTHVKFGEVDASGKGGSCNEYLHD